MVRRNKWMRARRWRAFFRVAGVWVWALLAALLASAALFVETWHQRRERNAVDRATTDPALADALNPESYLEQRSQSLALLGLWLPRLLWTGVGLSAVAGVGVVSGVWLADGSRAVPSPPRRRRSEERSYTAAPRSNPDREKSRDSSSERNGDASRRPRSPRPERVERRAETPVMTEELPPIPLDFDEPLPPPPPPKPRPEAPRKAPAKAPRPSALTPDDEERYEALY